MSKPFVLSIAAFAAFAICNVGIAVANPNNPRSIQAVVPTPESIAFYQPSVVAQYDIHAINMQLVAGNNSGYALLNQSSFDGNGMITIRPMLAYNGSITPLALPIGFDSGTAESINSNGDIVGRVWGRSGSAAAQWHYTSLRSTRNAPSSLFVHNYRNQSFETDYFNDYTLWSINDSGQIAGYGYQSLYFWGGPWSFSSALTFSTLDDRNYFADYGGFESKAFSISNSGLAVGEQYNDNYDNNGRDYLFDPTGHAIPYYHKAAAFTDSGIVNLQPVPGFANSRAQFVNSAGEIVGTAFNGKIEGSLRDGYARETYASDQTAVLWRSATAAPVRIEPSVASSRAKGLDEAGDVLLQKDNNYLAYYNALQIKSAYGLASLSYIYSVYGGQPFDPQQSVLAPNGTIYTVGNIYQGNQLAGTGISKLTPIQPRPYPQSLDIYETNTVSPPPVIHLYGQYFRPTTQVLFNNVIHASTIISQNQIDIPFNSADISTVRSFRIDVVTPPTSGQIPADGGYGGWFTFNVLFPAPTVDSITPSTVHTGSSGADIIVTGTHLEPTTQLILTTPDYTWKYRYLPNTWLSTTTMVVHLSPIVLDSPASFHLLTYTPDSENGSLESRSADFDVLAPPQSQFNISATPVGPTSEKITWDTRFADPSVVYYGTTPVWGQRADDGSSRITLHHSVTLTGLLPSTRYYYLRPDLTFVTSPAGVPHLSAGRATANYDVATDTTTVTLPITNSGTADAAAVRVTSATIGVNSATAFSAPVSIAAGGNGSVSASFHGHPSGPRLVFAAIGYTGGTFSVSARVQVP